MADLESKRKAEKYRNDFQKEKYDRIIVNVPKGEGDKIKTDAKLLEYKSLNAFVVDAIEKFRKDNKDRIENAKRKAEEA